MKQRANHSGTDDHDDTVGKEDALDYYFLQNVALCWHYVAVKAKLHSHQVKQFTQICTSVWNIMSLIIFSRLPSHIYLNIEFWLEKMSKVWKLKYYEGNFTPNVQSSSDGVFRFSSNFAHVFLMTKNKLLPSFST